MAFNLYFYFLFLFLCTSLLVRLLCTAFTAAYTGRIMVHGGWVTWSFNTYCFAMGSLGNFIYFLVRFSSVWSVQRHMVPLPVCIAACGDFHTWLLPPTALQPTSTSCGLNLFTVNATDFQWVSIVGTVSCLSSVQSLVVTYRNHRSLLSCSRSRINPGGYVSLYFCFSQWSRVNLLQA